MEKHPPNCSLTMLKDETKEILDNFKRNEINTIKDKIHINNVKLLLMVVTESEFHAALLYLDKAEGRQGVLIEKDRPFTYFIGNWGEISAALVKQNTEGIATARKLTCSAIRIFQNLKAIISLGVCGLLSTKLKLADVIVPTKITGYRIVNTDKNLVFSPFDIKCGKNIRNILNNNKSSWYLTCAEDKQGKHMAKAVNAPIITGHLKMENSKLKDRLIKDIHGASMAGIEMEGVGIWEGMDIEEKEIEFLVVKAGSDYANEIKNTQWQPFSAKAAADFVYNQLKSKKAKDWFLTGKIYVKIKCLITGTQTKQLMYFLSLRQIINL